jgi:hypothetical protein
VTIREEKKREIGRKPYARLMLELFNFPSEVP